MINSRVSGRKPACYARLKNTKSQLLGGSLTLLAGSGLVGVTNLVYNVVTARLLGPTGFAHATAVYTILMLLSCDHSVIPGGVRKICGKDHG